MHSPAPAAALPRIYGEHEATIVSQALDVLSGHLPTRALRLVLESAELHGDELAANWRRARAHEPLDAIAPLA
jgi:ubiquinone biosynthesis protein UbiJ